MLGLQDPRASGAAPFLTRRALFLCLKQNKTTRLSQKHQSRALRSSRVESYAYSGVGASVPAAPGMILSG